MGGFVLPMERIMVLLGNDLDAWGFLSGGVQLKMKPKYLGQPILMNAIGTPITAPNLQKWWG